MTRCRWPPRRSWVFSNVNLGESDLFTRQKTIALRNLSKIKKVELHLVLTTSLTTLEVFIQTNLITTIYSVQKLNLKILPSAFSKKWMRRRRVRKKPKQNSCLYWLGVQSWSWDLMKTSTTSPKQITKMILLKVLSLTSLFIVESQRILRNLRRKSITALWQCINKSTQITKRKLARKTNFRK